MVLDRCEIHSHEGGSELVPAVLGPAEHELERPRKRWCWTGAEVAPAPLFAAWLGEEWTTRNQRGPLGLGCDTSEILLYMNQYMNEYIYIYTYNSLQQLRDTRNLAFAVLVGTYSEGESGQTGSSGILTLFQFQPTSSASSLRHHVLNPPCGSGRFSGTLLQLILQRQERQ